MTSKIELVGTSNSKLQWEYDIRQHVTDWAQMKTRGTKSLMKPWDCASVKNLDVNGRQCNNSLLTRIPWMKGLRSPIGSSFSCHVVDYGSVTNTLRYILSYQSGSVCTSDYEYSIGDLLPYGCHINWLKLLCNLRDENG